MIVFDTRKKKVFEQTAEQKHKLQQQKNQRRETSQYESDRQVMSGKCSAEIHFTSFKMSN